MFKDFSNLNDALSSVDSSKTYFLDCVERLISTIRSGGSLGAQTTDMYARAYAQVQQTKYDSEGNISDVTSNERLTIPNAVLSKEKSRALSWSGELENAKSILLNTETRVSVAEGKIMEVLPLGEAGDLELTFSVDLQTGATAFDITKGSLANVAKRGYTFDRSQGTALVRFPGASVFVNRVRVGTTKKTRIQGLFASAVIVALIHDTSESVEGYALFASPYCDSQARLIRRMCTSTGGNEREIAGATGIKLVGYSLNAPVTYTLASTNGLPGNTTAKLCETYIVGPFDSPAGVGDEVVIRPNVSVSPDYRFVYFPLEGGLKVIQTYDAEPFFKCVIASSTSVSNPSGTLVAPAVQATINESDLIQVITDNAPDYTPVANALKELA